jgi:hypothetical protein
MHVERLPELAQGLRSCQLRLDERARHDTPPQDIGFLLGQRYLERAQRQARAFGIAGWAPGTAAPQRSCAGRPPRTGRRGR